MKTAAKIRESNREYCISCGALLGAPCFSADNFPASAQDMPGKAELAEEKGITLSLCRCPECGLFQLTAEPVEYYRDVYRAVGISETMKALRRNDYDLLTGKYGMAGKRIFEAGCGNGDFLQVLSEYPVQIFGSEANPDFCRQAQEKLPSAQISPVFPEGETDLPGAPFDCFLSFNFLEHQPAPAEMLRCLHRNLTEGGIGLITVPSLEYILKEAKYYELIRDHMAYYSMDSLCRLCEISGFTVLEKDFISIGDTLRVIVRKAAKELPAAEEEQKLPEMTAGIQNSGAAGGFTAPVDPGEILMQSYRNIRNHTENFIEELRREGRTLSLWGAGHQGFTLASTTRVGEYASYILDSSPMKQGKYAPASHLPIAAPEAYAENPTDVILIAAPAYVKEIEAQIRRRYGDQPEIRSILEF